MNKREFMVAGLLALVTKPLTAIAALFKKDERTARVLMNEFGMIAEQRPDGSWYMPNQDQPVGMLGIERLRATDKK